jgi:flagellar basal-body rod protein FlgB
MSSISQNVALLSQAMDLRTQRHQTLASNIANADTPQYKARDFSFEAAMKNSMAGRVEAGGLPLSTSAAGHLQGSGLSGPAALKFRTETQSAVDGNTVDMDVERSHIAENALQYQIVSQLITERFKGMRSALSSTQG